MAIKEALPDSNVRVQPIANCGRQQGDSRAVQQNRGGQPAGYKRNIDERLRAGDVAGAIRFAMSAKLQEC